MTNTENELRIQLVKRRLEGADLTRQELARLVELQERYDNFLVELKHWVILHGELL
jgi:hypothetical protein